ncbi:MAG TPA: transcriptional regulator, partial [Leptolyngbyaceae cyanobacterium M65_K2018_010]|nr:transcriptional regulator [Leptolyngbyaceae cyanobacterium M65_K2018_010]
LPSSQILALSPNTGNKIWVGTGEGLGWVNLLTGAGNRLSSLVNPRVLEARP